LGLALIHVGLTVVEAGRSTILAYTTPLWVTPLALFILKEEISISKALGLALGLAGVAVLFNPAEFDFSDTGQLMGNGYLIASAILLALVIFHIRHHRVVMRPLQLMPWQMLVGGTMLAVCALYWEGIPDIEFSAPLIAILAYNGVIASAFCFWAYQTIMRALPAVSTSLGSLGVPVAGIAFSAMALGETLSVSILTGMALILCGVTVLVVGDFIWDKHRLAKNDE
jgi:drug/metabolite transporter (DMT)-like permease